MLRAIETQYAGHLFRSRLEARWAALFDILEWEWTYEPFDANGYIPDFVIKGPAPVLVEVRPCVTWDQYRAEAAKVRRGIEGVWDGHAVVVGCDPMPGTHSMCAGAYVSGPSARGLDPARGPKPLRWFVCLQMIDAGELFRPCLQVAWYSGDWFIGMPCGHDDPAQSFRGYDEDEPTRRQMDGWWGHAHKVTRWSREEAQPMTAAQHALVNHLIDTDSDV